MGFICNCLTISLYVKHTERQKMILFYLGSYSCSSAVTVTCIEHTTDHDLSCDQWTGLTLSLRSVTAVLRKETNQYCFFKNPYQKIIHNCKKMFFFTFTCFPIVDFLSVNLWTSNELDWLNLYSVSEIRFPFLSPSLLSTAFAIIITVQRP